MALAAHIRKRQLRLLLFGSSLCSLLVLGACEEWEWNPSDRMRITSDVFVSIQQLDGEFFLRSRTQEIYSNSNNELITEVTEKDDELIIKYRHIDKCEVCSTALGPASALTDLPQVSDLDVVFILKGKKCPGTITDGEIVLEKEGIIRVE